MKKNACIILSFVCLISFMGCTGGAPKCGDADVKKSVIDQFASVTRSDLQTVGATLTDIRTTPHKEDNLNVCNANMDISGVSIPITYSTQKTDDGKVHVTINLN